MASIAGVYLRTERKCGNTSCTTMHFTQLCCIFMSGHYLKAYRATKMASGKNNILYKDDLDATLAVINADILENDENMELWIVTCIKNQPSGEYLFIQIRVLSKSLSIESMFIKAQESKTSTAHYPW